MAAAEAKAEAEAAAMAAAEAKALEEAIAEADVSLVTLLQERSILSPVLLMGVRRLDELVECSVEELKAAGMGGYKAIALLKAARALVNAAAAQVNRFTVTV